MDVCISKQEGFAVHTRYADLNGPHSIVFSAWPRVASGQSRDFVEGSLVGRMEAN